MVRASRNVSNLRRAAPVRYPEQVDVVPVGLGPTGEPEYSTVYTGRAQRPRSLEEWSARQIQALAQFRHMPACAALAALLEAGEDADVKTAGKPLDDWQRRGVLDALGQLADAASRSYPPAAAVMLRLQAAWRRQWPRCDGEVYPPRVREVKREPVHRAPSMAEDPPDAARVGESWAAYGAARRAASRPQGA